ncbi:MAG: efflux RND transporter periplasmic adaptor subunit [Myxococcota bacterium]
MLLALLPALILAGLTLGVLRRQSAVPLPSARVERGDVRITLTESGELRAAEQTTVSAANDKLITWLIPEGTRVKKGDLLIRFESQKYELAKSTAESMVRVARAELAKAESERRARRATEQKALLDYRSLPELARKGYINQNELEAARLAYDEVRAGNQAFDAAVVAARANVERAEQEVEVQQRKLDEGLVHAPTDGVVVYATGPDAANPLKISVGMIPYEGQPLIYLPNTKDMIVETEISEFDLGKVTAGSRAELRLDAYPGARFEGEVLSVGALARQKISRATGKAMAVKVFDVRIHVNAEDPRLKPGLSATVDFVVDELDDALYVPISAVFVDELDRMVAYRQTGGSIEARPLVLSGSTDRIAVVSEGLEEGDQVLLVAPEPG